jgi:hypothetical protein
MRTYNYFTIRFKREDGSIWSHKMFLPVDEKKRRKLARKYGYMLDRTSILLSDNLSSPTYGREGEGNPRFYK